MSNKAETTEKEWRGNANKRRTRQLIGRELLELFEVHDDVSIARHLVNILRSRGKVVDRKQDGSPVYRDPYNIDDAEFLKELEGYKTDLQNEKEGEEEV